MTDQQNDNNVGTRPTVPAQALATGAEIWRLFWDRRVRVWTKIILLAAIGYVIWPSDLPGPFDDLAVLAFGAHIFMVQARADIAAAVVEPEETEDEEDTVEADFRVLDDDPATGTDYD